MLTIAATTSCVLAQEEDMDSLLQYHLSQDSLLLNELESMLSEDSITVFDLIDSMSGSNYAMSQLSFRLGYTSNITNAGRNFGVEQHGIGAGVSYYHHSGLYADVSGYWNSDISPNYNPTVTSIGYMGNLTPSWSFMLGYDHYFYREGDEDDQFTTFYPLTNAINTSSYIDIGSFSAGVDYSFLFGGESAHRLRGNLMYVLRGKKFWFFDRFTFMPSVSAMLGNQEIYNLYPTFQYSQREAIGVIAKKVGRRNLLWLYRNNRDAFNALVDEFMNNNILWQEDIEDAFGLMNYSIAAPVYLFVGRFSILVYYNLNIPVALPGEELELTPNSYFGCTLMYDIPILKK